jgi:adenylate cyclase
MTQLLPLSFRPGRRRGAVVPRLCLLERFNADLVRGNKAPLGIGIGIGSIGSPERMEFTVIGNTVKVASRIEGLNKTMGTSLLLSKATKDHLTRRISLRALPPQQVKGVDASVEIFTIEP